MKLTEKQKRFCEEYLVDLNATQAALRAMYSKRTAYSQGQRLLKKVEIQKQIGKLQDRRSERTQITADKVLSDIENVRQRAKVKSDFRAELKALELLGRNLGMFTDNIKYIEEPMSDEQKTRIRNWARDRYDRLYKNNSGIN